MPTPLNLPSLALHKNEVIPRCLTARQIESPISIKLEERKEINALSTIFDGENSNYHTQSRLIFPEFLLNGTFPIKQIFSSITQNKHTILQGVPHLTYNTMPLGCQRKESEIYFF